MSSKPTLQKAAGAACVVVVALLAGCGPPHPGLSNGSVSACYRAIPAARAVVHDTNATLISVHRITADKVRQLSPDHMALSPGNNNAEDDTSVCAVAFKGTFGPGQVNLAPESEAGSYALVLVTSHNLRVVAAAVLNALPRSLGKRTL